MMRTPQTERKQIVRKQSRPRLWLLLLVALALIAASCAQEVSDDLPEEPPAEEEPIEEEPAEEEPAEEEPAGRELVFATTVATPSLHPYQEIADARQRRSPLMYDTLVEWDENLEIAPGLAESWELDDLEWTFHLRPGVTFHNGKQLTADDVVYSLQQVLESPGAGFYGAIEHMEAIDDLTVRLSLSGPDAALLSALGGRYAFIVPDGAMEEYDLNTEAVGTGVFKVAEFRQGEFLRLEKNPNHWRADEVSLDDLTIQVIPDESSIVAGLRGGTIHATIFEDVRSADLLEGQPGITITEDQAIRWDVLDFPLDVEPFNSTEFRQAIASALDRQAIMQLAIGGRGTLLGGHPPALWGALPPEEAPFAQRDVDRAKELLEASGFEGAELSLSLTSIQGYDALNAAAQIIVDNLSEIGLSVSIEIKELGVWIDEFLEREFDTFTMNSWGGFVDPNLLYFNHFHRQPEGADFRRWDHQEISELIDRARMTVDQEERTQLYRQIQEIIVEEVPLVPLYSANFVGAYRDGVGNWSVHPSGWYHDLRWLTLDD